MRCSLVHNEFLFIGTEEKFVYMIDNTTFDILDKLET